MLFKSSHFSPADKFFCGYVWSIFQDNALKLNLRKFNRVGNHRINKANQLVNSSVVGNKCMRGIGLEWYLFASDGKVMVIFLYQYTINYQYTTSISVQSTFRLIIASNFDVKYVTKHEAKNFAKHWKTVITVCFSCFFALSVLSRRYKFCFHEMTRAIFWTLSSI